MLSAGCADTIHARNGAVGIASACGLIPVLRRVEAPDAAVSTRPPPGVNPGAGALKQAASYVDIGRQAGRPAGNKPGK
jgi:hypothetical protein